MIAFIRIATAFAIMAGSVLPACAQDAMKTAEDLAKKWEAAYDRGDAAALADMFAANCVFNFPSGAVLKDREAIEKLLAGRMKAGWTSEAVTITQAGGLGDAAVWAVGDYAITGSGENAGKQAGGKFGEVLVRDSDGWHILMLTANSPPPPKQ